jgi:hypothetical protein
MSKLLAVLTSLSLLVCLPGGVPRTYAKDSKVSAPAARTETRVYTRRQCLISELSAKPEPESGGQQVAKAQFIGALAGIFVPLLIGKLISGVSSALKKAGADTKQEDSGRLPTYLYRLSNLKKKDSDAFEKKLAPNPDLGCVLIVRGTFSGADPEDQSAVGSFNNQNVTGADQQEGRRARLNGANIPVTSIATLYEAEIIPTDDQTALRYESRFLEVNSFQGTNPDKKDKKPSGDKRALVISIAIHGAGAKEGEPTLSLALLNMGEVGIGVMNRDQLAGCRSSWLGGVGLDDDALKAIEKLTVKSGKTAGLMPVTIEGVLIETKDGNAALKFIGEVLDSAKDDLTKTVSGEITKDRGAEAKEKAAKAADAAEKLRLEEEDAYAAHLNAVLERSKLAADAAAEEVNAKEFAVRRTKRVWCTKFLALQTIGAAPAGRACTQADLN